MYAVGEIPRRAERLIDVTYDAMMRGIAAIRSGATSGDIGNAIQTFVEAQHMSVVRDFCGHGLGKPSHDEPNILHVGRPGEGIVLRRSRAPRSCAAPRRRSRSRCRCR